MDLNKLLNPRKFVIAGATEKETYGGFAVKLMELHAPDRLDKDIFLVNPGRDTVFGHKCYHSISEVPEEIDMVIIASNKKTVPALITEAAAKGAKGAVVFAAGYGETGKPEDKALEAELKALCEELDVALMGPNCAGYINMIEHLPAMGFMTTIPEKKGKVGLVSQSGMICTLLMDSGKTDFSYVISCGNSKIVEVVDYIDFLIDDENTNVIVSYIEGVTNPGKFLATLKKAALKRKPVILLIDEYDVPLDKAKQNGYYREMLDVIRSLLSNALKTNDNLKLAVVTGCLRISKESIFTGVNNFKSFSVLDEKFSTYFGFTENEVTELLKTADLENQIETARAWYDGYIFGSTAIYCPWDVVNYVSDAVYNKKTKPKNYWINTSGNGIIRSFVENSDFDIKGKFETLLNGGSFEQHITDNLTYDRMYDTEENLWSVLLMTGYLTKADPEEEGDTVLLRLPNKEIAGIFEETVMRYFSDTLDTSAQKALMDMLWNGDEAGASQAISDLLWNTISYNDYHEDYYHAFLCGIFVGRGYGVESNKKRGLGRPDILLTDRRNRRALIIEAKKSVSEAAMEQDCRSALKQIDENQYAEKLYGYRQVLRYGIAFYRKTALVKLL